ncbi:endo-1,4-beta-xylanase [bacterium]|nr:endo-1,4-beta-xylanase [bacterium]
MNPTTWLSTLSLVGLCVLLSAGARAAAVPEGGTSLLPEDALTVTRVRPGDTPGLVKSDVIEVEGMPFRRALRVQTFRRPQRPWDISVVVDTRGEIRKGDVCLFSLHLRGPQSADESGEAVAAAYVQRNTDPWTKAGGGTVTAGRQWRAVHLPFKAKSDLPQGTHSIVIFLGYHPQTVEIGGVRLLNYGRKVKLSHLPGSLANYRGRAADAPWRQAATERIERFRKADLTVQVTDAAGKPVAGATVRAKMTRHAFGFGSAVTAHMLSIDSDDGRRYRQIVEKLYSKVVFENDLKWPTWDLGKSNKHSRYRREYVDKALAWLAARGIEVRGHYVTWAPLRPGWTRPFRNDRAGFRKKLFDHMADKVPAVGTRVGEWDAVNHIVGWGETLDAFLREPDIYVKILQRSRELAPGIELWVNEGQILPGGARRASYEKTIRHLMANGAAPDGVGFMGHFGATSLTPPEEVYAIFDRYAKLIPKLQITEFDVNVDDEELQTDYLRDLMTIAFSHPAVEAVVMWGFWAGRHWKPDAALYRRDWSIKPNGQMWLDLVCKQWWTDASATTDARGTAKVRGFLGDYEVSVDVEGAKHAAKAKLAAGGTQIVVGGK